MSFILDALKRSDRNRGRSGVPGLNTVHDLPPERTQRKGRLLLPILLSAGLILNGGALLWWQFSGQEAGEAAPTVSAPTVSEAKPASISRDAVARQTPVPSVTPSDPSPALVREQLKETLPVKDALHVQENLPVKEDVSVLEAEAARPVKVKIPPLPEPETGISRISAQPPEPVAEPVPSLPRIYDLKDLPPRVRQEIPEMSFSLHFYTDAPASRMVRIDGRMLREGASLAGGLRVQEITPEGVILEFRGYIFRLIQRSSG